MSGLLRSAGGVVLGSAKNIMGSVASAAQAPLIYRAEQIAWGEIPNRKFDLDFYRYMWKLGLMPEDQYITRAGWEGYNFASISSRYNSFIKRDRGGPFDLDDGKLRDISYFSDMFHMFNNTFPTPTEILELVNRGIFTERLGEYMIRLAYDGNVAIADAIMRTRFQIPGASDLISFAVREAFDPLTIEKFGYNKELPEAILPYMKQQGLGGELDFPMPRFGTTTSGQETRTKPQWFDLYWWSHWDLPSPTQGYEMLHRFYPDSRYGPSPQMTNDTVFTGQDLSLLLKTQDYPDYWRKRLEALSYANLTRVDVRRMFNLGVLSEADVYHAYRAIGYNDFNATKLLEFTKVEKTKYTMGRGLKETKKQITDWYTIGTVGYEEANGLLQTIGYSRDEANTFLDIADGQLKYNNVKERIAAIRRSFLTGMMDVDTLRSALENSGMKTNRREAIISQWQFLLNFRYKTVSAEKNIGWFKKSLINEEELTQRLFNLGYTGVDVSLMINEALLDMMNHAQKEITKIEKQRANEQLKQLREQERERLREVSQREQQAAKRESKREKELSKALSMFNQKNMIAWFKAGLLSEEQIDSILELRGIDEQARFAFKSKELGITGVANPGGRIGNETT